MWPILWCVPASSMQFFARPSGSTLRQIPLISVPELQCNLGFQPPPGHAVARYKRRQCNGATGGKAALTVLTNKSVEGATRVLLGSSRARSAAKHRLITLFRRARDAQNRGAIGQARSLLKYCLQLETSDSHSWLALARLEASAGNEDVARALFEEACSKCPNNVRLLHAHGVFEAHNANPEVARACFEASERLERGNAYVCHAWGQLEESHGNIEEARNIYEQCVRVGPQVEVYRAWAALEVQQGNLIAARAIYRRSVEAAGALNDGQEAKVKLILEWVMLERRMGKLDAARKLLAKASQLLPHSSEVALAHARFEWSAGSWKVARIHLRAAIDLRPCGNSSLGLKRQKQQQQGHIALFNAWASFEAKASPRGYEEALSVLDLALNRYPDDGSLLQSRGAILRRAGDLEGARKAFAESIRKGGGAPAFVGWALLEEAAGHIPTAAALFARGAMADVNHAPLHNARANFEMRRGNSTGARIIFEEACRRNPCATLWHGWSQLELRDGALDRAADLLLRGTSSVRGLEHTSFLWHSLGMVRLKQGKFLDALHAFKKGLRRNPGSSQLFLGIARVYALRGLYGLAREHFRLAINSDERHAQAWQAWGVFESRHGHSDTARAIFLKGLKLCPTHPTLWQAAATFEKEQSNIRRARSIYKAGITHCADLPKNAALSAAADAERAHSNVSYLLLVLWGAKFEMHQKRLPQAQELLSLAHAIDSSSGEVYYLQAMLLKFQGQLLDARRAVEEGLRLAPSHVSLYRLLGSMQDATNEVEAARASFREGLRLQPDYAQIFHAWARLEARLGNWEALNELNQRAKQMFPPTKPQKHGTFPPID